MSGQAPELFGFINGGLATGFLVATLFFVRFWKRTGDALFTMFGFAFGILAVAQPLPMLTGATSETQAPIYLLRLLAFVLIIGAVVRKNMQGRGG